MILYTVKYRKSGALFWRVLKKIKGDAIIQGTTIMQVVHEDERITEINLFSYDVQFSKERHYLIKERMSGEAGQAIQMESR